MRFSLKELLMLVLTVALAINVFIQVRASSRAQTQASEVRSRLTFFDGFHVSPQKYSREWARAKEYESDLLDQMEHLISKTRANFRTAASKIQVRPVADKLSVLELPVEKETLSFPRRWQVNVPESLVYELVIEFVDGNGKAQLSAKAFDDQSPVSVFVESGTSIIETDFRAATKDKPGSLMIKLNDDTVIQRVHLPKEYSGASSTVFDYVQQKDFGAGTNIVELLGYRPSPGDSEIRIRMKRVKP